MPFSLPPPLPPTATAIQPLLEALEVVDLADMAERELEGGSLEDHVWQPHVPHLLPPIRLLHTTPDVKTPSDGLTDGWMNRLIDWLTVHWLYEGVWACGRQGVWNAQENRPDREGCV